MAQKLKALQQWCKVRCDGYRDVSVTNMTSSWKSGLAFCAIIHRYRPDLIDYDSLRKENTLENSKLAFEVALHHLGIPALLDPEDMVLMAVPDKLCIITYVAQYYNYFQNKPIAGGPEVKSQVKASKRPSAEPSQRSQSVSESDVPENKKIALNEATDQKRPTMDDKCYICFKKIYLLERHYDGGKLCHRSCLRDAEKLSTLQRNSEREPNKENVPMEVDKSRARAVDKSLASQSPGTASGSTSRTNRIDDVGVASGKVPEGFGVIVTSSSSLATPHSSQQSAVGSVPVSRSLISTTPNPMPSGVQSSATMAKVAPSAASESQRMTDANGSLQKGSFLTVSNPRSSEVESPAVGNEISGSNPSTSKLIPHRTVASDLFQNNHVFAQSNSVTTPIQSSSQGTKSSTSAVTPVSTPPVQSCSAINRPPGVASSTTRPVSMHTPSVLSTAGSEARRQSAANTSTASAASRSSVMMRPTVTGAPTAAARKITTRSQIVTTTVVGFDVSPIGTTNAVNLKPAVRHSVSASNNLNISTTAASLTPGGAAECRGDIVHPAVQRLAQPATVPISDVLRVDVKIKKNDASVKSPIPSFSNPASRSGSVQQTDTLRAADPVAPRYSTTSTNPTIIRVDIDPAKSGISSTNHISSASASRISKSPNSAMPSIPPMSPGAAVTSPSVIPAARHSVSIVAANTSTNASHSSMPVNVDSSGTAANEKDPKSGIVVNLPNAAVAPTVVVTAVEVTDTTNSSQVSSLLDASGAVGSASIASRPGILKRNSKYQPPDETSRPESNDIKSVSSSLVVGDSWHGATTPISNSNAKVKPRAPVAPPGYDHGSIGPSKPQRSSISPPDITPRVTSPPKPPRSLTLTGELDANRNDWDASNGSNRSAEWSLRGASTEGDAGLALADKSKSNISDSKGSVWSNIGSVSDRPIDAKPLSHSDNKPQAAVRNGRTVDSERSQTRATSSPRTSESSTPPPRPPPPRPPPPQEPPSGSVAAPNQSHADKIAFRNSSHEVLKNKDVVNFKVAGLAIKIDVSGAAGQQSSAKNHGVTNSRSSGGTTQHSRAAMEHGGTASNDNVSSHSPPVPTPRATVGAKDGLKSYGSGKNSPRYGSAESLASPKFGQNKMADGNKLKRVQPNRGDKVSYGSSESLDLLGGKSGPKKKIIPAQKFVFDEDFDMEGNQIIPGDVFTRETKNAELLSFEDTTTEVRYWLDANQSRINAGWNVPMRQVNAEKRVAVTQITDTLELLDQKLRKLEHDGRLLEEQIRERNDEEAMDDDQDDLMVNWFLLVKQRYELVRDESELIYKRRQQELEDVHSDLEFQLRRLMQKPDHARTAEDRELEESLLGLLVKTVTERNSIVDSMEVDRIRYIEEDKNIDDMLKASGLASPVGISSSSSTDGKDTHQQKTAVIKENEDEKPKKGLFRILSIKKKPETSVNATSSMRL